MAPGATTVPMDVDAPVVASMSEYGDASTEGSRPTTARVRHVRRTCLFRIHGHRMRKDIGCGPPAGADGRHGPGGGIDRVHGHAARQDHLIMTSHSPHIRTCP